MCASKFLIIMVILAFLAWGGVGCFRALSSGEEGEREGGLFPFLQMFPILAMGILMVVFVFSPESGSSIFQIFAPLLNNGDKFFRQYPWMGIPAIALLVLMLIVGGLLYTEARIRRWVRRQGYELLNWHFVWFWNNPWGSLQSKYQHTYRALVRLEDGSDREMYVRFGSYWGLNPGHVEYIWGDDIGKDPVAALLEEAKKKREELRAGKDPSELLKSRW